MEKRIVIALGGNALQSKGQAPTAKSQLEVVKRTCEHLAGVAEKGYNISVVHGNGPQVGQILLCFESAGDKAPRMPFDVCGAMSQGYIGYHIQQALQYALKKRNINTPVAGVLTQMIVDPSDPAFENPTKPIGPFYSKDEAMTVAKENGYTVAEDAGRGYRRVVPSPLPKKIAEIEVIKHLVDEKSIVIACGGGGIPVREEADGSLTGIEAVIDKDYAAELLAEQINADELIILTEVEKAAINFKKPNQHDLDTMTVEEAEKYIEEGHFAKGSMLPKVKACVQFVRSNPSKTAIITSLDKVLLACDGKTGTRIIYS